MAHAPEQSLVRRHCFKSSGLFRALEEAPGRLSGRRSHSQLFHSPACVMGELRNMTRANSTALPAREFSGVSVEAEASVPLWWVVFVLTSPPRHGEPQSCTEQ